MATPTVPLAPAWIDLPDEKLLLVRIRDLGLKLEDSDLAERVRQLHDELSSKGLTQFKPEAYLGDEWFSPEGDPIIAIPFYLAHPRLVALERKMMFDVEGESADWCMRLLRHEAGHCFDHAYGFSKRREWKKIFGDPKKEYDPDTYHPRPYSRNFVRNIENWYAQSHPDEDFAETFAVWLNPASDWRKEYAKWPGALKKLQYIEALAAEASSKPLPQKPVERPYAAAKMSATLSSYYKRRMRERATELPDFYDRDLVRIFGGDKSLSKREHGAARFLHKNRRELLDIVARWTGEKKFTIDRFLGKLAERCEVLDLRRGTSEQRCAMETTTYLATLVTNYHFTGKFKRTV